VTGVHGRMGRAGGFESVGAEIRKERSLRIRLKTKRLQQRVSAEELGQLRGDGQRIQKDNILRGPTWWDHAGVQTQRG